jgi:Tfp pilus assembly protein PilN
MSLDQQQATVEAPTPARETVSRVDWAPVPRVNLLPPEVLERRRFRKVQGRLVSVIVLVLLVIAGAGTWSQLQVGNARDDLTATENRTSDLQREQAQYAQIPLTLATVDQAKSARAEAMGSDVLWYRFLNDVALALPSSVTLSTMTVTLNDASASSTETAPLISPGIGTVAITGTAGDYPAVASWMESVTEVAGVASVTLQTATREATDDGESPDVSYTAQLVVTDAALSHRYDQKAN